MFPSLLPLATCFFEQPKAHNTTYIPIDTLHKISSELLESMNTEFHQIESQWSHRGLANMYSYSKLILKRIMESPERKWNNNISRADAEILPGASGEKSLFFHIW